MSLLSAMSQITTKIVFLAGIPGTRLNDCANAIRMEAATRSPGIKCDGPYCLEKFFVKGSIDALKSYRSEVSERDYAFLDCLKLPYSEFVNGARNAFRLLIEELEKKLDQIDQSRFVIVTLHTAYCHQNTLEFITPHDPSSIYSTINEKGFIAHYVISLHDDIYDIHRELMKPQEMYSPIITVTDDRKGQRAAEHDYFEQLQILSWRDRELSASRFLASGLKSKHFLFHKKGRVKTIVDTVFEGKCNVYFSHPISQPRRDINNIPHEIKCKNPNVERGRTFIESCQSIADLLGRFCAVVEPTAIDELRTDSKKLSEWNEKEHLRSAILPPLYERWPIGGGERIHRVAREDDYSKPLAITTPFPEKAIFTESSLAWLESAQQLLAKEIKRQLTVRDNILAEQADLVFVYRPFSSPDSHEATGGVSREMDIILLRMKADSARIKPALLIYHPKEDEMIRRGNAFRKIWSNKLKNLQFPSDDIKGRVEHEIVDLIRSTSGKIAEASLKRSITDLLETNSATATPIPGGSTMALGGLGRSQDALREIIDDLVSTRELFASQEEIRAGESEEFVEIISEIGDFSELGERIRSILEGEDNEKNER